VSTGRPPTPGTRARWIGASPSRLDAPDKTSGRSLYVDDLPYEEGELFGKTVRSTVARGRLRGARFLPGVAWNEFVVVTAKDLPGKNVVALIADDQPFLADQEIRHVAEPVVLIAHADRGLVEKAVRLVELDVEPLPAVFTIAESLQAGATAAQYGDDNVFQRFRIAKGDAERALAACPVRQEGRLFQARRVHVAQDEPRPLPGEGFGRDSPLAPGRAGDNRDFSLKTTRHANSLSPTGC